MNRSVLVLIGMLIPVLFMGVIPVLTSSYAEGTYVVREKLDFSLAQE
jgi:hypothetical protein